TGYRREQAAEAGARIAAEDADALSEVRRPPVRALLPRYEREERRSVELHDLASRRGGDVRRNGAGRELDVARIGLLCLRGRGDRDAIARVGREPGQAEA